MDYDKIALLKHKEWKGKIEVSKRCELKDKNDLSIAYTPGVAAPCLEISRDADLSYTYTRRGNLVAVITDGTAVLGLGDIGPEAGMPVMEGKCVLFKHFGGVDAFPICIRSKSVDEIVNAISLISGSFGGINLEDISAPRCFEIERRLKQVCDIPIFHDDQHGTAVVTLAAMINSLKIVKKEPKDISVVVNGSGAAGIAITRLLMSMQIKNVILCDRQGAIYSGREGLDGIKSEMAKISNPKNKKGNLQEIIQGTDVFIGVSAADVLTSEMIKSMAAQPIIFAMANPIPEVMPNVAKSAGAKIIGTGRSDFPNQINNVLAFPGIFKGALSVRARDINDEMKVAAAHAIAGIVSDAELSCEYIIPDTFNEKVADAVASAVANAAIKTNVARI
ncbi:MAG: NAD-dependent malic enzyme [Firmicutes bacterium]|nr:NAD-dependent malic enzyme [Bacillota bacterium]